MERPELEASSDDAMDSFLEKFQSQPYSGGFHEDQWEEVGGPGVSARVCVCVSWGAGGVVRTPGASSVPKVPPSPLLALPEDRWFLLECEKSASAFPGSS